LRQLGYVWDYLGTQNCGEGGNRFSRTCQDIALQMRSI